MRGPHGGQSHGVFPEPLVPPAQPCVWGGKPEPSAVQKELEANGLSLQTGSGLQFNAHSSDPPPPAQRAGRCCCPKAGGPALSPTGSFPRVGLGSDRIRVGTLPPGRVMGPQVLSMLSVMTMRLVQIRQRPKWAASQVALWCFTSGLSTAQWSVTTATMASTMPTRMQKRVARTFSALVWDMAVAEEWVPWARSGGSVSQAGGSWAGEVAAKTESGVEAKFSASG